MTSSLFGETAANPTAKAPCEVRRFSPAAVSPRQLADAGLERAAAHRREALDLARLLAEMLAHKNGSVTADDVFLYLHPEALGKAAGAIFRDEQWEFIGWEPSTRASNHARWIRRWRLRGNRS